MAGLEVNVEGLDELRLELGLDRLRVPHITISFKSFGRAEKQVEAMVGCQPVSPKPKL